MTAAGPSEISIVRTIVRRLNERPNTYARKTHGGSFSGGWPDVVGCSDGLMLALEVKRPGGKATPLQLSQLAKWEAAGAITGVVTCWDDVRSLLDVAQLMRPR